MHSNDQKTNSCQPHPGRCAGTPLPRTGGGISSCLTTTTTLSSSYKNKCKCLGMKQNQHCVRCLMPPGPTKHNLKSQKKSFIRRAMNGIFIQISININSYCKRPNCNTAAHKNQRILGLISPPNGLEPEMQQPALVQQRLLPPPWKTQAHRTSSLESYLKKYLNVFARRIFGPCVSFALPS